MSLISHNKSVNVSIEYIASTALTRHIHFAGWLEQAAACPVIGFYVKDRLGQTFFGDDAILSCANRLAAARATPSIRCHTMSQVAARDYTASAALGDGTQEEHLMHYRYVGLQFKALASIHSVELIGVPISEIRLNSEPAAGPSEASGAPR